MVVKAMQFVLLVIHNGVPMLVVMKEERHTNGKRTQVIHYTAWEFENVCTVSDLIVWKTVGVVKKVC